MEPATSVAIWLLTNVVAPDAYQRIANAVSNRSSIRRLMREVKEASGMWIGRGYKRWLRDEATWIDLISRDEEAFERMVTRLVKSEARGALRRVAENRERAEKLVSATIAHFLPTLDPSTAVAISEMRSEERHKEMLDRFDARQRMDERLQSIPPSARKLLGSEDEFRALAERVVNAIVRNDPREIISLWYTERPRWLAEAPGPILLAFGLLAQSYGFRDWAGHLYEEAAGLGVSPAEWYARAALEAHAEGQAERQVEMVRLARAAGGGDMVEFLAAAMDEEWELALASLDENEAVQDPLLGALYAVVVGNAEGSDAEINVLSTVIERHPDFANARLRLAQLLLVRSRDPNTSSRERDLQRALDRAVEARDLLRSWRGESGEAVELATQASLLSSQWDLVTRLGTTPPNGEAISEEATRPGVQFNVAQAAMASGDHALAERVAASGSGFHNALLQAEILALGGANPSEVSRQYDVAWSQVESEQDKVALWLSASSNGVEPLPGADELEGHPVELSTICRASAGIANGRTSEAIDLLRPLRNSESARRLLAMAYIQDGDIDAAVAEWLDMAQRFATPSHRVRAVEILLGADRMPEAAEIAAQTLSLLPVGRPGRHLLHETLVAAAHNRSDWAEMETRARVWIAEDSGCRQRWLLVLAIFNQGESERAWQILQESDEKCSPQSEVEAQLWIALNARFDPSASTLSSILDVVNRFPDDPDVRRAAVNSFFLMGDDKGEIAEPELSRWHELIRDRADSPSPDDFFVSIPVPDDAQGLAEAFRPFLEAHARRVDEWVRKVRTEMWPYGMISLAAGRTYAETLVHRPTGFLPISSANPSGLELEVEAAHAALDNGVVVADTSTIAIASYIQEEWPVVMRNFRNVEVAASTRLDAASAADEFVPRSNESLAWDLRSDQPVRHVTDDETLDRIQSRLHWIRDQIFSLSLSETDDPESTERGEAWISAFRVARAASRSLWADDVGLRVLARNEGVSSFGTQALLQALVEREVISADTQDQIIRALRNEYCVDLPFTRSWLLNSARESEWLGGPAWLVMSRPVAWMQPAAAFEQWSAIAEAAADNDPDKLPPWVYAAVQGIGLIPGQLDRRTSLAAGILVKAATLLGFDARHFADCVTAATVAAGEIDLPDPTEQALSMTMDYLSQELGVSQAASITARLGSRLEDEHRQALRRILFDI